MTAISTRTSAAGGTVVTVEGEIDLANAAALDEALAAARAADPERVAVDLAGVTYLDSAGLRVLFTHAAQGPLRVHAPACGIVASVIAVTGLHEVATVLESPAG